MDLIFLGVQPDTTRASGATFADRIWMSESGDICAVIDGVSGCDNPVAAAEACLEYLDAQSPDRIRQETGIVLQELNRFLGNKGLQAVIAITHVAQRRTTCMWVGNLRLLSFLPSGDTISRIEPIETQPLAVLGQSQPIMPGQVDFDLMDDEIVLLTTDGLDHEALQRQRAQIREARSYRQWHRLGVTCQAEPDWSFVAFPIEKRFSYESTDWPYNPFIRPQEQHEHEKWGLALIASELFRHPEFDGFKIVGGITYPNANATRRLDGVLVSPLGVVVLELKDHEGDIRLPLTNREPMQIRKGELFREPNPVFKVIEVMPTFERFNLGEDIDLPLRKIGAVIFTNPQASVTCIGADGSLNALPYKSGDLFIVTPKQLAGQMRDFVKQIKGKRNRRPLEGKVERIVASLLATEKLSSASPPLSADDNWITNNGYRYQKQPLGSESTGYYQVYRGQKQSNDIKVWLKEYRLSQVCRGPQEDEVGRIGREATVLEKLSVSEVTSIQKSLGYFKDGDSLFVVLNEAPELQLGAWLASQPERSLRLAMLKRLTEILGEIGANGIVHRSVNPANIRINSKQQPVLINFELCRMETVQTLPVTARQTLDNNFVPREANYPGMKVTTAADIYSLGKIIILVLSGALPFPTYNDQAMAVKDKAFWPRIAQNCGLNDRAANEIASLLEVNPGKRPTASQVLEMMKTWT